MVNVLEGANLPYYFGNDDVAADTKYCAIYSLEFQKIIQSIWEDFLTLELGWNFQNNSDYFLESIQDYIEFVPDLLDQLKVRAILPFLEAFRSPGTYGGFAQACIGLFGEDVTIEYDDITPKITIGNITSPVSNLFLSEGREDFNFLTEDGLDLIRTEDEFAPPTGLSTIRNVLRSFLPAGQYEITVIEFVT